MDRDKWLEETVWLARKEINRYCTNNCESYCCKNYYITTKDPSLVRLIFGVDESKSLQSVADTDKRLSIEERILEDTDYQIFLDPCPSLKGNLCSIHNDTKRHITCVEYPLFRKGNEIIEVARHCPAISEGKIDKYLTYLMNRGLRIDYLPKTAA